MHMLIWTKFLISCLGAYHHVAGKVYLAASHIMMSKLWYACDVTNQITSGFENVTHPIQIK